MSLFLQKEETKETFLLISVIELEEGGDFHMHNKRKIVHTRTITLHYFSIEMQIAEIFSQVFTQ